MFKNRWRDYALDGKLYCKQPRPGYESYCECIRDDAVYAGRCELSDGVRKALL